jgi:hypothetical protein
MSEWFQMVSRFRCPFKVDALHHVLCNIDEQFIAYRNRGIVDTSNFYCDIEVPNP